jgi:hypothetical protein
MVFLWLKEEKMMPVIKTAGFNQIYWIFPAPVWEGTAYPHTNKRYSIARPATQTPPYISDIDNKILKRTWAS